MPKAQSRFTRTDFSDAEPERWNPHHSERVGGFRCRRHEFKDSFLHRIPRDHRAHLGHCWVIMDNDKLAAYVTLFADRLQVTGDDGNAKKYLKNEEVSYRTFPAVKIGLLAADERAKGAGRRLVEWAIEYVAGEIAPDLGVRFLTVDAMYDPDRTPHYDVSGYYAALGFRYANPNEVIPPADGWRTMFFDLKPIIEAMEIEQTMIGNASDIST